MPSSSRSPTLRGKAYLAVGPDCMANMPSKDTFQKAAFVQTTLMATDILETHIFPGGETLELG